MNKHYAVLINFHGSGRPLSDEIERVLSATVPDWLRFAPGQYLVATALPAETIYSTIRPLLHANDLILVIEVNIQNRIGWGQQIAVDWIVNHSSQNT